jgi:glycopeptide antibiotics resistance protein
VVVTSVSIEYLQWLTAVGRISDISDVLLNSVGGAIGIGVAVECTRYVKGRALRPAARSASPALTGSASPG